MDRQDFGSTLKCSFCGAAVWVFGAGKAFRGSGAPAFNLFRIKCSKFKFALSTKQSPCLPLWSLLLSYVFKQKNKPHRSLALPAETHKRDECGKSHCDVFLAAPVQSCAVIVVQQLPVTAVRSAVVRWLAACWALHQWHLVGGGPLLRPIRAGAVTGALAVVE